MTWDGQSFASQVQEWLAEFRAKPDTRFEMHRDVDGVAVRVWRQLPNSRDPDNQYIANYCDFTRFVPISLTVDVPMSITTLGEFTGFLRSVLVEMEMHELDEWFAHRGKLVDDPHNREVPARTTWTWGGDPKPDPPPPPKELS